MLVNEWGGRSVIRFLAYAGESEWASGDRRGVRVGECARVSECVDE